MAPTVLPLLTRSDRAALGSLLAPHVQFHSPFTDHSGAADVSHVLATIGTVLADIAPTRVLVDDVGRTTFLGARVEDRAVQGVLDERFDEAGRLVDATLFIRPYAALRVAIGRMVAALEVDPPPSRR